MAFRLGHVGLQTITLAGILLGISPPKSLDASADGAKDYRKEFQNRFGVASLIIGMLLQVFVTLPDA